MTFSQDPKELVETLVKGKSMTYGDTIYWFRDYWSNRLKLSRNIQNEDWNIDLKKGSSNEVKLKKNFDGTCSVEWAEGSLTNLVNPFELTHKYEPYRISFPLNRRGFRDVLPDPNYQIKAEQLKQAIEEPVVEATGEKKLWLELIIRVIIPAAILTAIEWGLLGYLAVYFPALDTYRPLIVILTLGGFLYSSIIVFIKIGISEATRQVERAKTTVYLYNGSQADQLHYRYPKDIPSWLGQKPYWVLRYLFFWSFELTLDRGVPFIRKLGDVERIDVWCDAKTGQIEWIVSDYHWRELWYKAEQNLSRVRVWLASNFHTPRPLTISIEGKGSLLDLYRKGHPLSIEWLGTVKKYQLSHGDLLFKKFKNPARKRMGLANRAVLNELNSLWWVKIRYYLGADLKAYDKTGDSQPIPQKPKNQTEKEQIETKSRKIDVIIKLKLT